MSAKGKPKPRTWESIYYGAIRRGYDPAYALYLAERWQERKARKESKNGHQASASGATVETKEEPCEPSTCS